MASILVVEDHMSIQRLLTLRLELRGHTVDCAADGHVGVEKALAGAYDLVLMDMHMPRMDGYAATRKLRSKGYTGTITALTASAMAEDSHKALAAGCDHFIAKPITADFEERIERIVNAD